MCVCVCVRGVDRHRPNVLQSQDEWTPPVFGEPSLSYTDQRYALLLLFFFFFTAPDSIYSLINISQPKKTLSLMSSIAQLAGDVFMDIVNRKWKKEIFDSEIVTLFDGATYMDSSSTAGGRRTVSVPFSEKRGKKVPPSLCSPGSNKNRWQLKWSMYPVWRQFLIIIYPELITVMLCLQSG